MTTLIQEITDFAKRLNFQDLPENVIHESKRILLDCIGCALSGLSTERGKIATKSAKQMQSSGKATIIGTGDKLSPFAASFANGELMNAMDYEVCTIPPGHTSPFVIPAPLALAEETGATGKVLICAIAAAHEISARFGHALAYYRDIVNGELSVPSISGYSSAVFGGTLAACMIMGLDSNKTAHALGLAGYITPTQSQAKWANTLPSAMTKYLMAGWICQASLIASISARNGYLGDISVLDGEYGFWRYIGSNKWEPKRLTDKLGEEWRFPGLTIYKVYPCCRAMQTALDCFVEIINEHGLEPEEIEKVTAYVDVHNARRPLFHNKDINTETEAEFSVPYIFSVAAHRVAPGKEWLQSSTLHDGKILAFMDRIECLPHPDYIKTLGEDAAARIGSAEVKARGRILRKERKYRRGSPATKDTYMTDNELLQKFRHNASSILPIDKVETIQEKILNLEDMNSLTMLWL